MPFKSKAQRRWMYAAEARGELPKGTAERWEKHTKNKKKLPERVSDSSKGEEKKSASRSASPVPGPDPGRGNLLVKWPLVMNPNGGKLNGKFIAPASYFGPNLLSKRLGKGPGSTQINSDGESPKMVHPIKTALYFNPHEGILGFLKKAAIPAPPNPVNPLGPTVPSNIKPPVELQDQLKDVNKEFSESQFKPRAPGGGSPGGIGQMPPSIGPGAVQLVSNPSPGAGGGQQNLPFGGWRVPRIEKPLDLPDESVINRARLPVTDEEGKPVLDEKGKPVYENITADFDVNWFRKTYGYHFGRTEAVLHDVFTNPEMSFLLTSTGLDDKYMDLRDAQRALESVASGARNYGVTPYELRQAQKRYELAKNRFLRDAQHVEETWSRMKSGGYTKDFDGYLASEVVSIYENWQKERMRRTGSGNVPDENVLRSRIMARVGEIARKNRSNVIVDIPGTQEKVWDWAVQALLKQNNRGSGRGQEGGSGAGQGGGEGRKS